MNFDLVLFNEMSMFMISQQCLSFHAQKCDQSSVHKPNARARVIYTQTRILCLNDVTGTKVEYMKG